MDKVCNSRASYSVILDFLVTNVFIVTPQVHKIKSTFVDGILSCMMSKVSLQLVHTFIKKDVLQTVLQILQTGSFISVHVPFCSL